MTVVLPDQVARRFLARQTEQAKRIAGLIEDVAKALRPLASHVAYGYFQRQVDPDKLEASTDNLAKASQQLLRELTVTFERPGLEEAAKHYLARLKNLKKMVAEWAKVSSWADLEPLLKKQQTKSLTVSQKFQEYASELMGLINHFDFEHETTIQSGPWTVALLTSARADWDRDKVQQLQTVLERTTGLLSRSGMGKFAGGQVFAVPTGKLTGATGSSGALASYNISSDVMKLSMGGDPSEITRHLVHETGHRVYFKGLGGNARSTWVEFFENESGPPDVDLLISMWEEFAGRKDDHWASKYGRHTPYFAQELKKSDPDKLMWLEIIASKLPDLENFDKITGAPKKGSKPGLDTLIENRASLKVFLHPVSAYSTKNAEELFAEVFSFYVVDGPGRTPEVVRYMFQKVLPGVRTASDRTAETKVLDLDWVEGLRKDFLTLLKNVDRVRTYDDLDKFRRGFATYRKNFDYLMFDRFLNKELKNNRDLSADSAKWINSKLRSPAWSFNIELSVPAGYPDEYRSEARILQDYQKEAPKWKARVQRKARDFWTAMKDVIEWYQKYKSESAPGPLVRVPERYQTELEGFKVILLGYDTGYESAEALEMLKAGLKLYRQRASQVAPILLKKQVPIIVDFEGALDKGGEYAEGLVKFWASSVMGKGFKWVAHVLAHEMGHHLYRTSLSGEAQSFWSDTIRGDFGDLDLAELLAKWPGNEWAFEMSKHMDDPIMGLQVETLTQDSQYKDKQTKEDFQALYDKGVRTIRVPKTPITGYAAKNSEEAFCEALGLLVAYGPKALHERVRWWLDTMMPGDVRVASQIRRPSPVESVRYSYGRMGSNQA